jgi:hypothetical protein
MKQFAQGVEFMSPLWGDTQLSCLCSECLIPLLWLSDAEWEAIQPPTPSRSLALAASSRSCCRSNIPFTLSVRT